MGDVFPLKRIMKCGHYYSYTPTQLKFCWLMLKIDILAKKKRDESWEIKLINFLRRWNSLESVVLIISSLEKQME